MTKQVISNKQSVTKLLKLLSMSCILACTLLSGCITEHPPAYPNDPAYAPVTSQHLTPPPNYSGSIYQENYNLTLYQDRSAHRVGDVLTVILAEQTTGTKSADTNLKKDSSTVVDDPTVLGSAFKFTTHKLLPLANHDDNNLGFNLSAKRSFKGNGKSTQDNSLKGSITVTVIRVMPNGNLVIRGEKWININQGDEFIRLTGIVRTDDVASDNTVLSTRIADARIRYSGRGEVAEVNAAGWLARLFNGGYGNLIPY